VEAATTRRPQSLNLHVIAEHQPMKFSLSGMSLRRPSSSSGSRGKRHDLAGEHPRTISLRHAVFIIHFHAEQARLDKNRDSRNPISNNPCVPHEPHPQG
jgi:hypothetical protein